MREKFSVAHAVSPARPRLLRRGSSGGCGSGGIGSAVPSSGYTTRTSTVADWGGGGGVLVVLVAVYAVPRSRVRGAYVWRVEKWNNIIAIGVRSRRQPFSPPRLPPGRSVWQRVGVGCRVFRPILAEFLRIVGGYARFFYARYLESS